MHAYNDRYTYFRFRSNVCDKKIKCDHMGKKDVIMHCMSKSHLDQAKALRAQPKLSFQSAQSNEELIRTEAELKMAVLTAISNVPLAFHDRLSPTIRKVFPDSKIALKHHSASTKATCMLNEAVAPMLINDLLSSMRSHLFSICIDGSNDTELEKMNPVTVRIFDITSNMVVTRFLDMCTTTPTEVHNIQGFGQFRRLPNLTFIVL